MYGTHLFMLTNFDVGVIIIVPMLHPGPLHITHAVCVALLERESVSFMHAWGRV